MLPPFGTSLAFSLTVVDLFKVKHLPLHDLATPRREGKPD
jgi:hypothetical protein